MILRLLSVFLLIGVLFTGAVTPALAQSSDCRGLQPLADRFQFPDVTIQFMVCDANGNPVNDLAKSSLRLSEDGRAVSEFNFASVTADSRNPAIMVPLINGQTFPINAVGASIGIVFDASILLNGSGRDVRDSINEGRIAIESFLLEAGDPPPVRTAAPGDPERVGLFIPVDQPNQSLRPDNLPTFTQDRYAVVNALRQGLPVRQGKTSLYAAVQAAIEATARDARQYNAEAIVLVVSDGGDTLSGDTLNSLINLASQQNVRIIAFGVGTDRALQNNGFRLRQLAEATGGRYYERPSPELAGTAFTEFVRSRPTTVYEVTYRTSIFDDGREHHAVLEVTTAGGNFSLTVPLRLGVQTTTSGDILSQVNDILLRYAFIGLPVAILLATIISSIFWAVRRSSIAQNKTLR